MLVNQHREWGILLPRSCKRRVNEKLVGKDNVVKHLAQTLQRHDVAPHFSVPKRLVIRRNDNLLRGSFVQLTRQELPGVLQRPVIYE
jgi:hypothetical protein